MNKSLKMVFFIAIVLAIVIFIIETTSLLIYHQIAEDCKEGEYFQRQGTFTSIGKCIPSAETKFCNQVKTCLENDTLQKGGESLNSSQA